MKHDGKTALFNLCAGDSNYYPRFCSPDNYESLKKEIVYIPRDELLGRGKKAPRDQGLTGDVREDGSHPLYLFPFGRLLNGEPAPVHPWTPTTRKLRDLIYQCNGQLCNHCVANRYVDGSDGIGPHQDKTDNMVEGSHVFNISFGAVRTMRLECNADPTQVIEIELQPGSMFELGWRTNQLWKHEILKEDNTRVSLTYRSFEVYYFPHRVVKIIDNPVIEEKTPIVSEPAAEDNIASEEEPTLEEPPVATITNPPPPKPRIATIADLPPASEEPRSHTLLNPAKKSPIPVPKPSSERTLNDLERFVALTMRDPNYREDYGAEREQRPSSDADRKLTEGPLEDNIADDEEKPLDFNKYLEDDWDYFKSYYGPGGTYAESLEECFPSFSHFADWRRILLEMTEKEELDTFERETLRDVALMLSSRLPIGFLAPGQPLETDPSVIQARKVISCWLDNQTVWRLFQDLTPEERRDPVNSKCGRDDCQNPDECSSCEQIDHDDHKQWLRLDYARHLHQKSTVDLFAEFRAAEEDRRQFIKESVEWHEKGCPTYRVDDLDSLLDDDFDPAVVKPPVKDEVQPLDDSKDQDREDFLAFYKKLLDTGYYYGMSFDSLLDSGYPLRALSGLDGPRFSYILDHFEILYQRYIVAERLLPKPKFADVWEEGTSGVPVEDNIADKEEPKEEQDEISKILADI